MSNNTGRSNLVIVAHALDEILNMGATLHKLRDEYWKHICVTESAEHEHRKTFFEICRDLHSDEVHAEILGYESRGDKITWPLRDLRRRLEEILGEREWDRIFTHNSMGEDGHLQHIQVHAMVVDGTDQDVYVFGHNIGQIHWRPEITVGDKAFKVRAAQLYAHQTGSLLAAPSHFYSNTESFGLDKRKAKQWR